MFENKEIIQDSVGKEFGSDVEIADSWPDAPIETVAKAIYEADPEGGYDATEPRTFWRAQNSFWPDHVWNNWLTIARAGLAAAEPFIQARIRQR